MVGAIDFYVMPLYYVSIKKNVINVMRFILKRVLFAMATDLGINTVMKQGKIRGLKPCEQ